jgi:hypothetical protein
MSSEQEVSLFLEGFKVKMKIWDVSFRDDRGKNAQTLIDLEIRPIERALVLEQLICKDFSEGPLKENLYNGAEMWVFGKILKQKEIYIKISMGFPGSCTLCISFHIAEHPMKYPFK